MSNPWSYVGQPLLGDTTAAARPGSLSRGAGAGLSDSVRLSELGHTRARVLALEIEILTLPARPARGRRGRAANLRQQDRLTPDTVKLQVPGPAIN